MEVLMDTDNKSAEETSPDENATIAKQPSTAKESAKKKSVAAKSKHVTAGKTGKGERRPRQSARPTSKDGKLVCRYCGSDDLSPSFINRRDARCRACFKKRYSPGVQSKKSKRARTAKATD
jgi:hypothetical protein